MRLLLQLLLFLVASFAFAQVEVSVQALMPETIEQGSVVRAEFTLAVTDGADGVEQGVWFLNVVEELGGGEVRQMSTRLFSSGTEDGQLFRRVLSGTELRSGQSTVLELTIRDNAPPGDYLIALQLFEGTVTNPSRVDPGRRLAMRFLPLRIMPRGG